MGSTTLTAGVEVEPEVDEEPAAVGIVVVDEVDLDGAVQEGVDEGGDSSPRPALRRRRLNGKKTIVAQIEKREVVRFHRTGWGRTSCIITMNKLHRG